MSDENGNVSAELIKGGVEVIKTLYTDGLQPCVKEVGVALGTVGKTVNIALAPIRGFVWGWDQIEQYVSSSVEKKLRERNVPPERIQTPDPDVAVPAFEAMRYSKLRENYAALIATSMDSAMAEAAHPGFVEILKQLTPDEAKILAFLPPLGRSVPLVDLGYSNDKGHFNLLTNVSTVGADACCERANMVPTLIVNLCRLGLTQIPAYMWLNDETRYDRIRSMVDVLTTRELVEKSGDKFEFKKRMLSITLMGDAFRRACM